MLKTITTLLLSITLLSLSSSITNAALLYTEPEAAASCENYETSVKAVLYRYDDVLVITDPADKTILGFVKDGKDSFLIVTFDPVTGCGYKPVIVPVGDYVGWYKSFKSATTK